MYTISSTANHFFHVLVVYNSSVVKEREGSIVDVGHGWVPLHLLLNVQHRHLTGKRAVTLVIGANNHSERGKVYSDQVCHMRRPH